LGFSVRYGRFSAMSSESIWFDLPTGGADDGGSRIRTRPLSHTYPYNSLYYH